MFEIGMFLTGCVLGYVIYVLWDHIQWGLDETTVRNTEDRNLWKKIFGGKER